MYNDVAFTTGQDYDRMKVLDMQADEVERMHRKKKKANPLTGFASECAVSEVAMDVSVVVVHSIGLCSHLHFVRWQESFLHSY